MMNRSGPKKPCLGSRFVHVPGHSNSVLSAAAAGSKKRVEDKIASGVYEYVPQACYCGSREETLLSETDSYGIYYPLVICRKCGIVRANPRLSEESYIDLYAKEYRTLYGDDDIDKEELFNIRLKQADQVYGFITSAVKLPRGGVVYDVGCNMGTMLLPFHKAGFETYGVDYGVPYIEYGRAKTGLDLEAGGIEKLRKRKKADLVILNHVFEHFMDLGKELRDIREITNPGCYLYVAVPGTFWWVRNICNGDPLGMFQNAHTWQFSLRSLKYVMECCGFEFVSGNDEVRAVFRKRETSLRVREDVPVGEFGRVLKYLKAASRRSYFRSAAARILKTPLKRLMGKGA
jgi:2-polyprenyl-3-methyl-5-hydroxy-6-metoxy-1,4-benzoquinol methylase